MQVELNGEVITIRAETLADAIAASGAQIVTVSLRREGVGGAGFRDLIAASGCRVLPNTAGCHSASEAITTARMARKGIRHVTL